MKNQQTNKHQFKWAAILAISALALILRVVDFVYEAIAQNFHISRIGLDIMGTDAVILQLAIIFSCALFLRVASEKLFNLQPVFSDK